MKWEFKDVSSVLSEENCIFGSNNIEEAIRNSEQDSLNMER